MARPTLARSIVGIALAVLTAQACGDGIGPERFAGSYDLRRYEGAPIPVITSQSSAGSVSIVAQRIVLGDACWAINEPSPRAYHFADSLRPLSIACTRN